MFTVAAAAFATYGVAAASPDDGGVRTLHMRGAAPARAPLARLRLAAMKKQPAPPPALPAPPPDAAPAPAPEGSAAPPPASTAPPPPPAPGPAPAPADPGDADEQLAKMAAEAEKAAEGDGATVGNEVIEVTGSLVDRKTLDTPAPVQILDRETLKATGENNIGTVLQFLPAQFGGSTVNINNGGDGATRVNLRGLGSNRTLVLMNGRRMAPSGLGADSSVDLSTIPAGMIERIEILKDGASAIYGSDAIGGVVNIITRKDFRGTEATIYTGETSHGDGLTYDASLVTGAGDSKGNVVFSVDYTQEAPVYAGDRDFSRQKLAFSYDPATYGQISGAGSFATPNGALVWDDGADPADVGTGNALWQQVSKACPSGACTRDGNMSPFRDFSQDGNSDVHQGDLYNFQPLNYLRVPLRKYNVFTQAEYKLSDHLTAELEGLYTRRSNSVQLAPEPIAVSPDQYNQPVIISRDNVYNPFARDITLYDRRLVEAGDRTDRLDVDVFRLVAGLRGDIPDDAPALKNWKWELSYNFGHTSATDVHGGSVIVSHLVNALGPTYKADDGTYKCGTRDNPGPADCVPANLLGVAGSVSQDALDYLLYTGVSSGYSDQKTALAQAHGQVFKTPWDGDVALAVGADYRKEAGGTTPDPLVSTGDTSNPIAKPTAGKYDVAEAFGELSVVPVTNRALAKYLEVDGAFRAYDYDTFGSGVTWKASALYKAPQGIAVRGTYSTAFRAPNVGELFAGQQTGFPTAEDPCNTTKKAPTDPTVRHNCYAPVSEGGSGLPSDLDVPNPARQLKTLSGGNAGLKPETATTLTAGVVVEPTAIPGLAATVDYFRIRIDNAISTIGPQVILDQCYTQTTRQYCDLVKRSPQTGGVSLITDLTTNVGGNDTSGVDFSLAYNHEHPRAGRFRAMFDGVYLLTLDQRTAANTVYGIGVFDLGVLGSRVRTNTTLMWGKGNFNAGLTIHEIGGGKECAKNDCTRKPDGTLGGVRGIDYAATGDIFASYALEDAIGHTSIGIGVNNVADTPPPRIYAGFAGNSDQTLYDYRGRFGYVRLTQSF